MQLQAQILAAQDLAERTQKELDIARHSVAVITTEAKRLSAALASKEEESVALGRSLKNLEDAEKDGAMRAQQMTEQLAQARDKLEECERQRQNAISTVAQLKQEAEEARAASKEAQRVAEQVLDAKEKELGRLEVRLRETEARVQEEGRKAESAIYQERTAAAGTDLKLLLILVELFLPHSCSTTPGLGGRGGAASQRNFVA